MNTYTLLKPIQDRVKEIEESLYPNQLIEAGDEKMFYGTFDIAFKKFYNDSIREGKKVTKIDFYNNIISELDKIEESTLQMESNINSEGNITKFYSVFDAILRVKEKALELIKEPESEKNKVFKSRSTKYKLTYNWGILEDKLYDFKRFLIKENLIDKDISFQDFKAVFSNIPITDLKQKIIWKSNLSQLLFLIKTLNDTKILASNRKYFDHIQLKECFVIDNSEKINLKNSKASLHDIEYKIDSDYKELISNFISTLHI